MVEVARVVTSQLAPDEMPLFDETARAWLRRRGRRWGRDDLLGFGLDGVQPVITIAALTGAAAALRLLGSAAADAGRKGVSEAMLVGVRRLLSRLRRRPAAAVEPEGHGERLSPSQLARIREVTWQRLHATGLSHDQAALVADAVVGSLVISSGDSGGAA